MNSTVHAPSRVAVARILNAAADAPRPTRTAPGQVRTNWSDTPCNEAWKPAVFEYKNRPRVAAPVIPVVAFHRVPVFTGEDVKNIMLPCSPPQFRTPKKGPNAGKPVEVKRRIQIITRTVTGGDGVEYTFTNRSSMVRVSTGPKLTPAALRETFARRWPDKAADLASFLLMEA